MIDSLLALFDEVRLLEHRLIQAAEALHGTEAISVPGRGVLEYLERAGRTSVPDIARARYVTRQHIQTTVDVLLDRGLVATEPNPAHRRSPLVALTPSGSAAIRSMHHRESEFLERRMGGIHDAAVVAATTLLAAVRTALDEEPQP